MVLMSGWCNRYCVRHFTFILSVAQSMAGRKGRYYDLMFKDLLFHTMDLGLRTPAACPEDKSSDSASVVFMSHGTRERVGGMRQSHGNPKTRPYDTIFQVLNNHNCSHLRINPKSSPRPAEVVSSDGVRPSGRYVSCRLRAILCGSHLVKLTPQPIFG